MLLLFFANCSFAQIAYNDALTINKCISLAENTISITQANELITILKQYRLAVKMTPNPSVGTRYKVSEFIDPSLGNKNPFFINFKNNGITVIADVANQKTMMAMKIDASDIPGPSDFDVTNIANGLAKFLIKRGKEELDVAFFTRMKTFLESHIECKTIFPETTNFLETIAGYRYSELIQSLREAFHKDLTNLIVNFNQLIDLPQYQKYIGRYPEIRLAIRSATIVSELSQSNAVPQPDKIIEQLATLDDWEKLDINLGNSWQLLNVVSSAVHSATGPPNWVSLSDMNKNIFSNQNCLTIFLGLIYQNVEGIHFQVSGTDVTVQTFMFDNYQNISVVSNLVENFELLANDLDRTIADFEEKKIEHLLTSDDYYDYINKAINIFEYGSKIANAIQPGVSSDYYVKMALNANDLYKNIYSKNYNNAVMDVYNIADQIFNHSKDIVKDNAVRNGVDLTSQTYRDNLKTATADLLPQPRIIEAVLKYGNFMASVVKADNADDVEKAIESAALPAGSSSIKKNTAWNIALNAYIGYYSGRRVYGVSDAWHNNQGVTAPVGITISKSLWKLTNVDLGLFKVKNLNTGSLSAFVTLINIGSIVDYQLNHDSTAVDQKIKLGNIFSPGGYIVYGFFGNLPLSIGYGCEYGPRVFQVVTNQSKLTDNPGWRSNWFFTIDIPLVNFWSVNKLRQNK